MKTSWTIRDWTENRKAISYEHWTVHNTLLSCLAPTMKKNFLKRWCWKQLQKNSKWYKFQNQTSSMFFLKFKPFDDVAVSFLKLKRVTFKKNSWHIQLKDNFMFKKALLMRRVWTGVTFLATRILRVLLINFLRVKCFEPQIKTLSFHKWNELFLAAQRNTRSSVRSILGSLMIKKTFWLSVFIHRFFSSS